MVGCFLAMDVICSRSVVLSERVCRLRKLFTNFASSALRAASAGDVVRPRVSLSGFSALMISPAERSSAASATPNPTGKASPMATIMQAKLSLRVLSCTVIFLSQFLGALSWLADPDGNVYFTRRRVNEAFLEGLLEEFHKNGAQIIHRAGQENPATFLKVLAQLVPRELSVEHSGSIIGRLSDEQLGAMIAALDQQIQ